MNRFLKPIAALLLILPLANAQQTRVSREGGGWVQEVSGSLTAVKTLHVKIDGAGRGWLEAGN